MSLLIKALASAEKDKQKVGKSSPVAPLATEALTLTPMDLSPVIAMDATLSGDVSSSEDRPPLFTLNEDGGGLNDHGLSLAEEAGFAENDRALKNYTISKPNGLLGSDEAKKRSKTEAFDAAALASVAQAKAQTEASKQNHQKAAAGAFVANHAVKADRSRIALILLAAAGVLIILLGMQGYQYIKALSAGDVIVVKPVATLVANDAESIAQPVPIEALAPEVVSGTLSDDLDAPTEQTINVEAAEPIQAAENAGEMPNAAPALSKSAKKNEPLKDATLQEDILNGEQATDKSETLATPRQASSEPSRKPAKTNQSSRRESSVAESRRGESRESESAEPLKLVAKTSASGVDPTLLSAYEAFNRGEYAPAQQKYRSVLQKDVRNIDALLGMAAIAQRQNRSVDAIGWYRKILEIEPRNTIAQSAIADLDATTDVVGAESKLKSMIARQPEAASLHAALGNLYAAQNQWASAQSAYFNASQFAPISADYAFNLAISLEHLGKPKLALVQYQRSLDLLNMTSATSPDKAQLEARISALQ